MRTLSPLMSGCRFRAAQDLLARDPAVAERAKDVEGVAGLQCGHGGGSDAGYFVEEVKTAVRAVDAVDAHRAAKEWERLTNLGAEQMEKLSWFCVCGKWWDGEAELFVLLVDRLVGDDGGCVLAHGWFGRCGGFHIGYLMVSSGISPETGLLLRQR